MTITRRIEDVYSTNIDFIISKGAANRQEIKDAIKMSNPTVLYWLRKLIKEEKIETTTLSAKDPNVRYRLKKP